MGRGARRGVSAERTEDLARAVLGAGGLGGWRAGTSGRKKSAETRALLGTWIHALSPEKRAGKEGSEDTATWDAWWEWEREWERRKPALGTLPSGWQHPTSCTHHNHHYLFSSSFACKCSNRIGTLNFNPGHVVVHAP